jgi:pSer/pThr/pTyr-binding forkhead associated (FHA) protein
VRAVVQLRWSGKSSVTVNEPEVAASVVREAPGELVILLRDRPISFGRASVCDVCLPFVMISRRHFVIAPHADGYAAFDLDSTGGTYVNQMRVSRWEPNEADRTEVRLLENGDTILLNADVDVKFCVLR